MTEDPLTAALEEAAAIPGALGAVLCDFEGEAVLTRVGTSSWPPALLQEATEHIPEQLPGALSGPEFVLRLAAAEPCALLALFGRGARRAGAGELGTLELSFRRVFLVVERLPEDYYLVIVLDRRAAQGLGRARVVASRLRPRLAAEIG